MSALNRLAHLGSPPDHITTTCPSGITDGDWDLLFEAVLERMRATLGESFGASVPEGQKAVPERSCSTLTLLECADALDRLRIMARYRPMARLVSRRLRFISHRNR
ncbi:MAG: hypothetical protein Q8M93_24965 [Polaromonas sp.]|uniref:hypothetical protein n=1 Tax=Polaromonas sp. TaxID=1869339 RepID=UPI00272FF52B|nr:hypothetical protein [Polaromonas sp.]MDP2452320.1 hypothetical protein [Polaromonas sp.]MDP3250201.1 hypothetical protein [Polaromonas sp.]MDP3754149.1 hypothetical protein [Polaromonas sp.]MDP3828760.1 hypothetical protein [Polaromonas sp.]